MTSAVTPVLPVSLVVCDSNRLS